VSAGKTRPNFFLAVVVAVFSGEASADAVPGTGGSFSARSYCQFGRQNSQMQTV